MLLCALIFSVLAGDSLGDLITSHGSDKQAEDGNSVTLYCNYTGNVYNLLWYRQYQRSKPELLLYMMESGDPVKADPSAHWLSAKADKQTKLMELEISPAKASYSAQYYCALQPTVTGNPSPLHIIFLDISEANKSPISSNKTHVSLNKGSNATLSCTFDESAYRLHWYRQKPGLKLEFLLLIDKSTKVVAPASPPLLHMSTSLQNNNRVDLEISSADVSDSAVYYCALEPTLTENLATHGVVYNLLWYRQYQRSKPELLLYMTESGDPVKADPSAHWLSAKVDKDRKLMELEISPAKASYSARYKDYTDTVQSLQWYRQYPRSKPEFLLYIYEHGAMSEDRPHRFSAEVNKDNKQVDLKISSAVETDSAMYYCALVPTVTGNPTASYKNLLCQN
ncbi:hypothetical protein Q8A67_008922 [Cirrhinus molitorella]|uniref:Ig-like domain-containing protein n=1 Tax=Cirrhinus molitorella TaxID=172907 RepID=A0AA88PU78_9TELE|nr:hypothetical protein Q8A67_008922 [Cirrhinus molitorella]